MKVATLPLIFGASYFCLLRTAFGSIASCSSQVLKKNMSTTATTTKPPPAAYVPGSSSIAFITTPDEASAKKLARSLVETRLSVCVNIVPKITSIYMWEEKVLEDNECMLIVKTRTSRVNELTKYVRDNHPYSIAEVITMPIQQGNPSYMDWIERTMLDADAEEPIKKQ